MTRTPSRLSDRDQSIVLAVTRFHQVSAHQLRRLFFHDGSPTSQPIRQRRVCARLVKWGSLARLPRPMGGGMGGSDGYVYLPAGSRTRIADPHTLDITSIYVDIAEAVRVSRGNLKVLAFQPEPYCHVNIGHLEVKPDSYVKLETSTAYLAYWLEVDRGTEYRPQLHAKMRRYCQAYEKWGDATFPKVVFIVHDKLRLDFIESVVRHQVTPSLFAVVLFDDVIPYLIGG